MSSAKLLQHTKQPFKNHGSQLRLITSHHPPIQSRAESATPFGLIRLMTNKSAPKLAKNSYNWSTNTSYPIFKLHNLMNRKSNRSATPAPSALILSSTNIIKTYCVITKMTKAALHPSPAIAVALPDEHIMPDERQML